MAGAGYNVAVTEMPTVPLVYAVPRRKRRLIVWRRFGVTALLICLAAASIEFGLPLWDRIEHRRALAKVYSLQQRCLSFALPGGTPVYAEGPGGVALAKNPQFRLEMSGAEDLVPDGRWGPFFCATYHPDCWTQFQSAQAELSPNSAFPGRSVVFLHERHSPSGQVRLVMVEFCPIQAGWFRCNVIVPGTRVSAAAATLTCSVLSVGRASDTDLIQIRAGQPDPNNSSHFTIECLSNGKPAALDGYLKDGDRVVLRPRSGTMELRDQMDFWWPQGRPLTSPAVPPP